MQNFLYTQPTNVYFGKDSLLNNFEIIFKNYNKILLVYGQKSIKKIGLYDKLIDLFNKYGKSYVELSGIKSNPNVERVYEGIDICKKNNIDLVLAVGGGSVIDSAKAISIGSKSEEDIFDIFIKKIPKKKAVDIGVILTIPGAGSETSNAAVITKKNLKLDYSNYLFIPKFAVLDPNYTLNLQIDYTLFGISDAIVHIFERYFSNTKYTKTNDHIAEGILKSLIYYTKKLKNDSNNYDIRAEIMWACKLAHDNICGVGKQQDWASHIIANTIGGFFDKPHGAIVGIINFYWINYLIKTKKVNTEKFKNLCNNVFGCSYDENVFLQEVENLFFNILNLPTKLSKLDINLDEKIMQKIVQICISRYPSKTIGNFVRLDKNDIKNIIKNAI